MTVPQFLLDTNIISEVMREKCDKNLLHWYNAQKIDALFLSSVTTAELWQGVFSLPSTHPRFSQYHADLAFLEQHYHGRILPFEDAAAKIWGSIRGQQRKTGRILPELDMQIAAIALQHKLTLVTANTRHFAGVGLALLNPKEHK